MEDPFLSPSKGSGGVTLGFVCVLSSIFDNNIGGCEIVGKAILCKAFITEVRKLKLIYFPRWDNCLDQDRCGFLLFYYY